jgi:hypothetical protein
MVPMAGNARFQQTPPPGAWVPPRRHPATAPLPAPAKFVVILTFATFAPIRASGGNGAI